MIHLGTRRCSISADDARMALCLASLTVIVSRSSKIEGYRNFEATVHWAMVFRAFRARRPHRVVEPRGRAPLFVRCVVRVLRVRPEWTYSRRRLSKDSGLGSVLWPLARSVSSGFSSSGKSWSCEMPHTVILSGRSAASADNSLHQSD